MSQLTRHEAWLNQAHEDLAWGRDSLAKKYYAQSCFIAQQVGEKALKALAYFKGFESVKGHSILNLGKLLNVNGEIESMGRKLDLYYMSARYPDALPDYGVPSEHFGEDQAREALDMAKAILAAVKKLIG
jgi:HEPN domain-containing protein